MEMGRRGFLKGFAMSGALAATKSVLADAAAVAPASQGGFMTAYADKPIPNLRVGVIGLGMRGSGAVHRLASIPGNTVVALCDLYPKRVAAQQKWLASRKKPKAREYTGKEGWKALCESDLDLVYIVTPWALHAPMALYAMQSGKHAVAEVPSAMSLDECWALVETSEKTRRHCMQLENCCYGEVELLALNLVRSGILGELVHAEGAYIHDLRQMIYQDPSKRDGYQDYWRLKWNSKHAGNCYPTHGLVPLMQAMNVNRGDRLDYLTAVATDSKGMEGYAKLRFGPDSWQAKTPIARGDMCTAVIRTVKGRTIMIQHDVASPRPYSRINLLSGTRGILSDYPLRIALSRKPGGQAHEWMDAKALAAFREKHCHPYWKTSGALAKKIGGHGGMDFLMDLRLSYCLQNGLPLDMDVYDLAASCSLCELTERSVRSRGSSQDVPDFTRGGWKTAKPLGIVNVDTSKMGVIEAKKDDTQLNV